MSQTAPSQGPTDFDCPALQFDHTDFCYTFTGVFQKVFNFSNTHFLK